MSTRHRSTSILATAVCLAALASACGDSSPSASPPADRSDESSSPAPSPSSATTQELAGLSDTNGSGAGQGRKDPIPDDNVVGGKATTIQEWPWTVAVVRRDVTADNWCGGVLINPTRVLTAAHCVVDGKGASATMVGPDAFMVVAGRTRIDDTAHGQEVPVQTVWAAQQYDPAKFNWDYAILDLAEPITGQNPIKLPSSDATQLWPVAAEVTVAGWGCERSSAKTVADCADSVATPLKVTTLTIGEPPTCDLFPQQAPFDDQTELCLHSDPRAGTTCTGDSGGPYIVQAADELWYLVGLVSYGIEGCPVGEPVVAAKVPFVLDSSGALRRGIFTRACVDGSSCPYPA